MVELGTLCDALYRQTLKEEGLFDWSFEEKEMAKNERNMVFLSPDGRLPMTTQVRWLKPVQKQQSNRLQGGGR